ncbi:MAG: c-type cytochrome [Acidobacteriaceae bacterium]
MSQHLRPSRLVSSAALFALAIAMAATAQSPTPSGPLPDSPAQGHMHRPRPKPTNLQVLPKDYTGEQVIEVMRKFTGGLGVECNYCHAKNSSTGHMDFASDANPMKDRARVMLRMTMAINQQYISQLKDPPATHGAGCGTCHRGFSTPPAFVPPTDEHHHDDGPPHGPPPPAGSPQ